MNFTAVEKYAEIITKTLFWFVLTFISTSLYDMQKN